MNMIRVLVKNAQQAMDLKDQVVAHGLILHEDFSWEYSGLVQRPEGMKIYGDDFSVF